MIHVIQYTFKYMYIQYDFTTAEVQMTMNSEHAIKLEELVMSGGGGGVVGSGTNCRTQGVLTVLFGFFAETPPPLHLVLETNCF